MEFSIYWAENWSCSRISLCLSHTSIPHSLTSLGQGALSLRFGP